MRGIFTSFGTRPTAAAMLTAAALANAAEEATPEHATFGRVVSEIAVDGRLDESNWQHTRPVTRFFETYPRNVAPPRVRTEARFLYDDKYVYVGVTAYDQQPAGIRSGFVKRDYVSIDQDYIEILLDPLGTQSNAFVLRTNPSGGRTDGQFSEQTQELDTRPDLDFDVGTSVDSQGWYAEFRIPLSALRYRAGPDQVWRFIINRNRPRTMRTTIQSSPTPRETTCTLCFAGAVGGISIETAAPPVYVTPQVTYARSNSGHEIRGGIDAKWVPRPDTVVDLTLRPDFSQVEADDLQLTANAQFTLALKEKRPFFLEATDLFTTPILAIYTRSFAEPMAGARITHRGQTDGYSALVLRDRAGGILLEPGALSSIAATQPYDSSAIVARYEREAGAFTWGVLGSARVNDGARGGSNSVYGADATWAPTSSDRFSAQLLASATTNPDRPDLLPSWDGRRFDGGAYSLMWQHASDRWYVTASSNTYTEGFRAWNGFVPQVDVSMNAATMGLTFYPDASWLSRLSPGVAYSNARQLGGGQLSEDLAPSLSLTLPFSTDVTVNWSPRARQLTIAGPRTYEYWSITLTTTPVAWMPTVSVISLFGEGIDFSTGDVNASKLLIASVPLRLVERLELTTGIGYQAQDSRLDGRRLFIQRYVQLDALWHFSSKAYLQALYQNSRFESAATPHASRPSSVSRGATFSALLSYQANWQTRYFLGVRRTSFDQRMGASSSETEVFAKFSYLLSKWR